MTGKKTPKYSNQIELLQFPKIDIPGFTERIQRTFDKPQVLGDNTDPTRIRSQKAGNNASY
jgi:hypothetical protein